MAPTEFFASTTQTRWTPLITAAWKGKRDVVIELLDNGADMDAQNNVCSPCDVVSVVLSMWITCVIVHEWKVCS